MADNRDAVTSGLGPQKCCSFKCNKVGKYSRGKYPKETWYCQAHAPSDVQVFQRLALRALQLGTSVRIRNSRKNVVAK